MDYKCIFFDLDHTLWDYETNSQEALIELHTHYKLTEAGIPDALEFIETFKRINTSIWSQYDQGLIHGDVIRQQRFHMIFQEFGLDNHPLSMEFSKDYIQLAPTKVNLVPHALETLDHLKDKYHLSIITNGFEEIQSKKIQSSGIGPYFKSIVTSERAGCKKPSRGIFDFALQQNGYSSKQAVMIGDNLMTDMAGGQNAFIDTVFYNPYRIKHTSPVTYEIAQLIELTRLL